MSKSVTHINSLSINQIVAAIMACGTEVTPLVQGHMGTGKSSILWTLAKNLPTHTPCYFDCTTKDLGDITIPNLKVGSQDHGDFVSYATNEELGVHLKQPIILMIDEYGKANPAVKNSMLRLMLERKIGQYELHPDSLIFATTNFGAEGVGDLLQAHQRNRITILTMRKPSNEEWIEEWAVHNNIDPIILAWCREHPELFYSFEDVKNADENQYIFHPKSPAVSFVTPRSLEKASKWIAKRHLFDNQTLQSALAGTIGHRAAADLNAFIVLADELPSLADIKLNPLKAKVPKVAAAVCMVVYRSLMTLDNTWVDAWMDYMDRLDPEAQGLFVKNAMRPNSKVIDVLKYNKKFSKWALENNYLLNQTDVAAPAGKVKH